MRNVVRALVVVAVAGGCAAVMGQEGDSAGEPVMRPLEPRGAYGVYRDVWEKNRPGVWAHGVWREGRFEAGEGGPPVEVIRVSLVRLQPEIVRVIEASRAEELGASLEPIGDLTLHDANSLKLIQTLRWNTRMLRSDAARLWSEGDRQGAAERLAAMHRVARQLHGEPGFTAASTTDSFMRMMLEGIHAPAGVDADWGEAERTLLLEELERVNPRDPAGYRESWRAEMDARLAWARAHFAGDDAGAKLDRLLEDQGYPENWTPDPDLMEAMKGDERERMVRMWEELPRHFEDRRARDYSAARLGGVIERVAELVEKLDRGMREGSGVEEAEEMRRFMMAEETQLAKLLLVAATSVPELRAKLASQHAEARRALGGE